MKTTIVITSISAPNRALRLFAEGAAAQGWDYHVVGDTKSPAAFELGGCTFHSLAAQLDSGSAFARLCPTRHYARKNYGYLVAAQAGAEVIVDTDDDNLPRASFWEARVRRQLLPVATTEGWLNAYRYFSARPIWPRGLPLDRIHDAVPDRSSLAAAEVDAVIQQGLADENPDVDAIYRLVCALPFDFEPGEAVALGRSTWCPFNSQNTTWFRPAFPLLYLPAYCSFRMTDIWRSFVAQRLAWENGWSVTFHRATVWQERNAHNLLRDFEEEVPGYLGNEKIRLLLAGLSLRPGAEALADNLRLCYRTLVEAGFIGAAELPLLDAWLAELPA